MIELETIAYHEHYPKPSGVRVSHYPGDRYTVTDAPGLTAAAYAAVVIAMGMAKPIERKPKSERAR